MYGRVEGDSQKGDVLCIKLEGVMEGFRLMSACASSDLRNGQLVEIIGPFAYPMEEA